MSDEPLHPTVQEICSLLDKHGIAYRTYNHTAVTTSQEANSVRPEYTLKQGLKALVVQVKKKDSSKLFIQLVVPGNCSFSPKKVRAYFNASSVSFAQPEDLKRITKGIQPGGVPPFGNLWELPVYADTTIFENEIVIFNCGDRRVSISMKSDDYKRVSQCIVGDFIKE